MKRGEREGREGEGEGVERERERERREGGRGTVRLGPRKTGNGSIRFIN